jgi:NADH-quinone oxidoreductase subunit J
MFPIYSVLFFIFAVVVIGAGLMVILSRNPVHAILFLILAFFASSILWLMLHAEFLALVLIFVYVGAVMTLFLFVVMMLNIDLSKMREKFVRYLPLIVVIALLLIGVMIAILVTPKQFAPLNAHLSNPSADYSNVKSMGTLLYTQYIYPFEIAGVILLVAIIAAIALAFHGRKPNTKVQRVQEQLQANKRDRLRIIKMESKTSEEEPS